MNQRKNIFRLLKFICPGHLYEELEGDLTERYVRDAALHGDGVARTNLFWSVLGFIRPGIVMRNRFSLNLSNTIMFQNYVKSTTRHIARSKVNFVFKVGGLSLAFFSFLVIILYISYQLSFDTYHEDYERIYRVNSERLESGKQAKYGVVPSALGEMVQSGFPEVEAASRVMVTNGEYLRYNNNVVYAGIAPADSSVFDVLTFQFIQGNRSALSKPNSMIISKSMAKKVFGSDDPLHKIIAYGREKKLFEITGVVEDTPPNSHFALDGFISYEGPGDLSISDIISPVLFVDKSCILFVKLRRQSDESTFVQKVESLLDRHMGKTERSQAGFHIFLQPLASIYMDESLAYDFSRKGSIMYLYIFFALGFFLMVVASINYINLSIADFGNRTREIGMRKIMGARRRQIVGQIVLEAAAFCVVSLCVSVLLLYLTFPGILTAIDPNLRLRMLLQPEVIAVVTAVFVLLVILTSAYPALRFSTSNTSVDLKSGVVSSHTSLFNKSLLLTQFAISIICMVATITVGSQISFVRSADIGIDRRALAVMMMPDYMDVKRFKGFQEEIRSIAGVQSVSNSSFRIGGAYWKDWYAIDVAGEKKSFELYEVFSDDQLFSTLGMNLVEGRIFRSDFPSDSTHAYVVNETAVRELGLKDPLGTQISTHPESPGKWVGTIVGVVADFNISPLREKIKPLVMRLPWQDESAELFLYVKIDGNIEQTMRAINEKFHAMIPDFPMPDFQLVDDFLDDRYRKEKQAFASLQFGSVIVVLLSAMGIFSMSMHISLRRMKEFGIRKVLGATVREIGSLHTNYFLRIVLVANIVAMPVAYFLMKEWLNGFAYRTELSSGIFLIVGLLSLLIVIISAFYSSWKAGRMNPVDVIKMRN